MTSPQKPFPFQECVAEHLLAGRSVILQAPTGAGKTLAALWPYLERWNTDEPASFPRQCIYSAPARVLVNQFAYEVQKTISEEMSLSRLPSITVQTGERPEDHEFMGDLIFTTIDQTLSNFLNVPYALSGRKANVNAGAVVGSYLVFDEFHLFPHDDEGMGAMPATIQMLRLLRHTTPFVLMTATFSQTMLEGLATLLDLDPKEQVIVVKDEEELRAIDTRWDEFEPRRRSFVLQRDQELTAQAVQATHQTRSLAVFNTVVRAVQCFDNLLETSCKAIPFVDTTLTDLYKGIEETSDSRQRQALIEQALEQVQTLIQTHHEWEQTTWTMLLHARFESGHRAVKEEFARRLVGPVEKRPWSLPSLVLVATQVIEVGLNLTGEHLHTEIAHANSVLQRAGRCARFPGEQGTVHIYEVPMDKKGEKRNYLPYTPVLCEATWAALTPYHNQTVNFIAEQKIINEAHGPDDAAMLKRARQEEGRLWGRMEDAIVRNDLSARRELIRQVDSRTLLVCKPPEGETTESPYRMRGFSLYQGSLRGKWGELEEWTNELDIDWALKYPKVVGEEEDSRSPTKYQWSRVKQKEHLSEALLFAVHPDLVAYDALRGFRFVAPETGKGGQYETPKPPEQAKERFTSNYHLESYAEHIHNMIVLYEQMLSERLAYVGHRLENHPDFRLPLGTLDRAVRLAIALHDAGKLQVEWQMWARNYQQEIGEPVPDYLIAHTHSKTKAHEEAAKKVRPKRPNHAGEGAIAGYGVSGKGMNGSRDLTHVITTAITRHHSPQAHQLRRDAIRFDSLATETIRQALEATSLPGDWAAFFKSEFPRPPQLDKCLLRAGQWDRWLLYFLIVRVVRLMDGKSQERT